MPRVDWSRLLLVSASLLALAAVAWVTGRALSLFRQTLTVLALGAGLAFVARPLVDALARPLRLRPLAVAVVILGFLSLLGLGLALLAGPVAADIRDLLVELPAYERRLRDGIGSLQALLQQRGIGVDVQEVIDRFASEAQARATVLLGGALALLGRIGTTLTVGVLGFVVSIYLLLDGARIREACYALLPEGWRRRAARVEAAAAEIFGGYVRGQLFLGLIIGLAVGVGAALFGLPYPFLIGVLAGIFELIPSIGAVLGSILPLALSLAQPFPTFLYVLAFLVVVQQVEGNLLVPRITGRAVGLHPLAALLALIAGLEVAGLVGAFLGAPVVSLLYRLLLDWRATWEEPVDGDGMRPGGSQAGSPRGADRGTDHAAERGGKPAADRHAPTASARQGLWRRLTWWWPRR